MYIKSKVVWYKNKNKFVVIICGDLQMITYSLVIVILCCTWSVFIWSPYPWSIHKKFPDFPWPLFPTFSLTFQVGGNPECHSSNKSGRSHLYEHIEQRDLVLRPLALFHSSCGLMKYPYTKTIHMISTERSLTCYCSNTNNLLISICVESIGTITKLL